VHELRDCLRQLLELDQRLDHKPDAGTSTEWALRNKLVIRSVELALAAGLRAGYGHDRKFRDFSVVAYIDLPTGQVSWHLPTGTPPSPPYDGEWDGHSHDEKAMRITVFLAQKKSPPA
jgi:hypothetical protein